MYSNILFDLDGTITDPGEGITNSVAYALEKFGIKNTDRSELYCFIGPPLKESFAKYYGLNEEQAVKAVEEYRVYFKSGGMFENTVYDGVESMLAGLRSKGKKLFIATSKPEEFAVTILEHFGLDKYFDRICGASMDGIRSEKADVIAYTLDVCGITNKAETVMIGDRKHDIIGASANGIDSVGVLYGYGSLDELTEAKATYIAKSVDDISRLV